MILETNMGLVLGSTAVGAAAGAALVGVETARNVGSHCTSGYVWAHTLGEEAATIVHGIPVTSPRKEIAAATARGAYAGGLLGGMAGICAMEELASAE